MSDFTERKHEVQETPDFSLTKVVEDVSQHGIIQTKTLKEKQKTLSSLQATLADIEKKGESAEQELRSKVRELLMLEVETEHLEGQTKVLHDRCSSISTGISELQVLVNEEEEKACMASATFNTYRQKMKGHRAAVVHAASQTEVHKELEEKKVQVRKLTLMKEQLMEDLENPNGNSIQVAKREIDTLKRKISEKKMTVAERRGQLKAEFEKHAQLKKDIEIQNRRHEAIVKRLCCQLSRAQAVHRQMSDDVFHMQSQLAELRRQQRSSQDSAVSDY